MRVLLLFALVLTNTRKHKRYEFLHVYVQSFICIICKLTNNKAQCFWCINSYVCKVSFLLIENSVMYVELEQLLNNIKILL